MPQIGVSGIAALGVAMWQLVRTQRALTAAAKAINSAQQALGVQYGRPSGGASAPASVRLPFLPPAVRPSARPRPCGSTVQH